MKHINTELTIPKIVAITVLDAESGPGTLIPNVGEIFTWTSINDNRVYLNYWIGGETDYRSFELGATATQTEANLGTNNDRYITPLTMRNYVESLVSAGGNLPGFTAIADDGVNIGDPVYTYFGDDGETLRVGKARARAGENQHAADGVVIGFSTDATRTAMIYTYSQLTMDTSLIGSDVNCYLDLDGGYTGEILTEPGAICQKLGHTIGANGILFSLSEPRFII